MELVWIFVAGFELISKPSYFYTINEYVMQSDFSVKRFQASHGEQALLVPLNALCHSHHCVKPELDNKVEITEASLVILSTSISESNLDTLVAKIRQLDATPQLFLTVADATDKSANTLGEYSGEIEIELESLSQTLSLYRILEKKPGLTMSPASMRKMPEDKDHLKNREGWFKKRYNNND